MSRTFHSRFTAMLAKRIAGIREVLTEFDPFDNWKRNRMPESSADTQIELALFLLYANHKGPETQAFLERAIKVADRAMNEKKCESKLCRAGFPGNRAEILRVRAYANSLLSGEPLDLHALAQASRDYEAFAADVERDEWDEITQPYLLSAIRLALVCDDLDRANDLALSRKCTDKQKKEQDLWVALLDARQKQKPPLKNKRLLQKYDAVFDRMRNTYEAEEIAALEMGVLRHRFFISNSTEIDWDRIIASIGA